MASRQPIDCFEVLRGRIRGMLPDVRQQLSPRDLDEDTVVG